MINSILEYPKGLVKSNSGLILLTLLVLGLIVYYPTLTSDFFGDDYGQIVNSPPIQDIRNIPSFFQGGTFYIGQGVIGLSGMYYRPLMLVFYSLIYNSFGPSTLYFHLLQLLVHIVNSFLVYKLFHRLFRRIDISFLLSLVFLIHPLNVEAVAYIANLQDVLFFFFGISALHLILNSSFHIKTYVSLFILLLLTLLSKESGLVFLVLLYSFIELFHPGLAHGIKKRIGLIMFGVVGTYAVLRCGIANICLLQSNAPIADLSFIWRIAHIPSVVFYYLRMTFFPDNLAIFQQWSKKESRKQL